MSVYEVTVVIPTRNESGNIQELVTRLECALGDTAAELLFVDDSDDDTPQMIAQAGRQASLLVRCLHRESADRSGGLGSAVVTGFRASLGRIAVVMDGDLQHPPEMVPALVRAVAGHGADIVVASRNTNSHQRAGVRNFLRIAVSKMLFPRSLRSVTDPMSGFFAVDLTSLAIDELDPIGYKVLVETIVRSDFPKVSEVNFTPALRYSGASKAGVRKGHRVLHRLLRLRLATLFGARARRPLALGLVGASVIAVNTLALWLLSDVGHIHYLVGAALATQVSMITNFVGTEVFVHRDMKPGTPLQRFLPYAVADNAVNVGRLPLLGLLVSRFGFSALVANALTLVAVFVVRFSISDRSISLARADLPSMSPTERIGPVDVAAATERSR